MANTKDILVIEPERDWQKLVEIWAPRATFFEVVDTEEALKVAEATARREEPFDNVGTVIFDTWIDGHRGVDGELIPHDERYATARMIANTLHAVAPEIQLIALGYDVEELKQMLGRDGVHLAGVVGTEFSRISEFIEPDTQAA